LTQNHRQRLRQAAPCRPAWTGHQQAPPRPAARSDPGLCALPVPSSTSTAGRHRGRSRGPPAAVHPRRRRRARPMTARTAGAHVALATAFFAAAHWNPLRGKPPRRQKGGLIGCNPYCARPFARSISARLRYRGAQG